MALPSRDLTWATRASITAGGTGSPLSDHRDVLLEIVSGYLATGGSLYLCRGSSNSVAAALDGVNRWAAPANLVWANAPTAHSWIVFREATTLQEICIALDALDASTQGPRITVVSSPAGSAFAGGTVNARPTAANELVHLNGDYWLGTSAASASFNAVVHYNKASDGQASQAWIHIADVCVALWRFDQAQDPVAGWTTKQWGLVLGAESAGDDVLTLAKLWSAANAMLRHGTTAGTAYLASWGYAGQSAAQRQGVGGISGNWKMFPLALFSDSTGIDDQLTGVTPGARGIWDAFYGSTAKGQPVDYYPSDGSKLWVQNGCLISPWNGTVQLTS